MQTISILGIIRRTAILLLVSTLSPQLSTAFAQGTAFTYQGRLNSGTNLAGGSYDLTFTLFATNTSGVAIAGPVTNNATGVANGLFTTTVSFGPGVFTGGSNWLEIAVRTNGSGSFTTLTPRQQVTPVPYAITAENVSGGGLASGTYGNAVTFNNSANSFSGSYAGDGGGLTNLNAGNLSSGSLADARLSTNVALRAGGNTFTGNQIFTNGSVGIGTASPQDSLNVNGNLRWGGTSANFAKSGEDGLGLFVEQKGSSPANSPIRLQSSKSGDAINYSQFFIDPTNGFSFMSLGTGNGSVGIGTTTPASTLDVNGNIYARYGLFVNSGGLGVNSGGLDVYGGFILYTGDLYVNGLNANAYKPGGGSWGVLSDERLKKNIHPLKGVLDELLELQGVNFEYKDPETIHELSGERIGMIAQQVEKVFPDWVSTNKDGYKTLTYHGFEALTVEALRELRAEKDAHIKALKTANDAKLGELQKQNEDLRLRLERLEKLLPNVAGRQ